MKICRAALPAFAAALLGGCDHHVEIAGPAGIPYLCADGRAARIFYEGGDPNRAPARLDFDGRTSVLRPAPAMNGLRYEGQDGLVWSAQGDEARLSRAGADGGEDEIVRCTRRREGETAEPAGHAEDH
jgi:membrane-bound inhibitor of C-type lysozyme